MRKILNIAHRGASAYAPENTLESIEKAIELGADMAEFDLRCTVDGVIVLWHDERVWNRDGKLAPVSNISANDLDLLARGNGFELARFDELLKEFGSRIALDIEIKTGGFEEEIVYLLKKYAVAFPPVISSFHPGVIRKIKRLDSSLKTALVVGNNRIYKVRYLGRAIIRRLALISKANSVHLNIGVVSASVINELTDLGFDLYIWTVNDRRVMENLINMGIAGIITDKPDLLNLARGVSVGAKRKFSEEEII
ncbi:MAG: glycerophosphodiester phosphodiesterase [Candidatus Zixiibacteriota bacterium]|nr:MAG: glycerophosphodiester phosphodiesterase [candidate division Zixibacteria bacterium]